MNSIAANGAQRSAQANPSFFQRYPNVKTALKVAAVVLVVLAVLVLVATVPHVIAGTVLAAALLKVSSATIFIAKVSAISFLGVAAIAKIVSRVREGRAHRADRKFIARRKTRINEIKKLLRATIYGERGLSDASILIKGPNKEEIAPELLEYLIDTGTSVVIERAQCSDRLQVHKVSLEDGTTAEIPSSLHRTLRGVANMKYGETVLMKEGEELNHADMLTQLVGAQGTGGSNHPFSLNDPLSVFLQMIEVGTLQPFSSEEQSISFVPFGVAAMGDPTTYNIEITSISSESITFTVKGEATVAPLGKDGARVSDLREYTIRQSDGAQCTIETRRKLALI